MKRMFMRRFKVQGKRLVDIPRGDETGHALILVLILLLVGGLVIAPLLGFVSAGLMSGQVYEEKMAEFFAADAGIEDGLWQIKNDQLTTLFPLYDMFDYTTVWTYPLSEQINDKDVSVTIGNIWIPMVLAPTPPDNAREIIEDGKLIVTGRVPAGSTYQIRITFHPDPGEEDALNIETLGIWLPPGFYYVPGSSNLEYDTDAAYYPIATIITTHAGGQAVVWFFPDVPFTSFPGVSPGVFPLTSAITFEFTGLPGQSPFAIAWITTSGVPRIELSWDADSRVHKITSTAGGTEIEAYAIKSEMRALGAAMAGDYRAVGNSLMVQGGSGDWRIRYELLTESDATVNDLPADVEVIFAYLYWSGWFEEGGGPSGGTIFLDDASDFISQPMDWTRTADSLWSIYDDDEFRGGKAIAGSSEAARTLTFTNSLDLSSYSGQTIDVSWQQRETGRLEDSGTWVDILHFAFSGNGGSTWSDNIEAFRGNDPPSSFRYTIPGEYLTDNFKLRFYLNGPNGWRGAIEYAYIDDIVISVQADTTAIFKINGVQVYFDVNGVPQIGAQEITADRSQVVAIIRAGQPHGHSYSAMKDVTALVLMFTDEGRGNAIYTVGGVEADTGDHWSYAGWSLIIIYSSPETKGHQLYLFDDLRYAAAHTNLDFDGDGQPGGTISGFLVPERIGYEANAATLTAFVGEGDQVWYGDNLQFNQRKLWDGMSGSPDNVWDGQSLGLTAEGVDIDTFYITWDSELLQPGDTSAQIDIYTGNDIWNLVYIILSFRSEVTTGGSIVYRIR